MAEKELKLSVMADTSLADKQIDQFKKNAANKEVEIKANIDVSAITKALHSIQGMVGEMQTAFGGKFKFSGLQKEIDNISAKINNLIRQTTGGTSYIDVNPLGLEDMDKNISEISSNIKSLNSTKIDLDSFNKLAETLKNIEQLTHSIVKGMNFDNIRPSVQIQEDIDATNQKLNELANTEKKITNLEKYLNSKTGGIGKGKQIIEWGDSEDVTALDNLINKMKEYMSIGGDLSKIKFKQFNMDTQMNEWYSLADVFKILQNEGKIDFINEDEISNEISVVQKLRSELVELNDELIKAKNRENRDLNVSIDTKSIEEFSASMSKAVEKIGQLNFVVPENFSFEGLKFDGLSVENLDKILGKLDEIVITIKNITDLLSENIDTSKLNIDPKIDKGEIVKKIENQVDDAQVNTKIKTEAIIDDESINGIITKIQDGLRNAAATFGEDLTYSVEDFSGSLKVLDFNSIFSSLRESLLDIVKQFQTSLNNVSFSKEQTGEIYSLLKQWNDASSVLLKTGNKDSERAALLNQSSGSVSNSYLYDKEGSFSGKILDELNRLSMGVSGQIGELYDTWVHSHPLQKAEDGLKAIGANIGFSPEDFNIYKNKYFDSGVTNMMVANNGKYTNINWEGISKELIGQVISLLKSSDIFNADGTFRGNKAVENDVYNFDKQSSLINSAIIDAMKKVGIQDAESRLTTGNIENLSVDLSRLQQQEQNINQETQQLVELFQKLSNVVDSVNNGSFQFGISEDSLKSVLDKLNEIVEAIKKINTSSIQPEVKLDNGLDSEVSKIKSSSIQTDGITKSVADESQQISKLKESVTEVTTAVDTKTRAFQEEEQIVVGTVQREISSLQLLDGQLYDIVGTLEKLQSSSVNLGFKSGQDNIDNGILRLFNDLNEAAANLNIDSLTKISESLKGIEVPPNTSENLKQVAVALKEFKENISGLSLEDNNLLSSIDNLVSKTADLKTLCQTLENSAERIKEANKLLNDNTGQDDTNINASEKIKSIKNEIESLSSSLNKGFKNNLGIEKFIDQLEEVSRKYRELNNLKSTNPEAIDTTEFSSLSRYYATFLEDLSANSIGKFDLSTKTPQFVAQLTEAQSQLILVQAALAKVQSGEAFTDEDIANIKKYIDQIRELNKVSKQDSSKFANYANVHNMLGKLADIMNKNTSMSKGLRQEFEALDAEMRSFGGNIPADQFKEFGHRLAELEARMKKTRQTGLSFFDGVAKKARTMSQNFIAMYFSFYDWIRYIRQGFTVLKELDTALTEMRKVSDESLSSLKNYQKVSFDAASAVGTTGKQIQNSTADWMRLGETLDDAAKSAEVSNILLNVSEFEGIDQATESLVAMSAAYSELEKIDIVDKLNEVG